MVGEEILQEIDNTLNCLIKNAEAIEEASCNQLSGYEKEVFQKTQESLLAHLISVDQKWVERRKELKQLPQKRFLIQDKWSHLQKMHGKKFEKLSQKMGVFTIKKMVCKKRKKTYSKKNTD